MNILRRAAKAFAITTIVASVFAASFLTVRTVINAAGHLDDQSRSFVETLETIVVIVDGNDLRNIATALAISAGVATAWYKLDIFREFEPHVTIEQTIKSQPLGDSYLLIVATAVLTNNSKVLVKPVEGYCRLAQLSPLDDSRIVEIYVDALREGNGDHEQFGWPILKEIKRKWTDGDISIEPGESHQETYQFIVDGATRSVVALTAIYNPSYRKELGGRAEVWRCYAFYDVPPLPVGGGQA